MQKLVLSGIFLFLIVFPSYAFADGPYLNIPPTNAFDKIHSDNGTVSAVNFSMPLIIKGGNNISVQSSNASHTITITNTQAANTNQGTYNKTLANNSVINSGGNRLNFINGTNNPLNIVNDPTRNQVNITISSTGSGGGGVTSLNALTGALNIVGVTGNTTVTTSGGNTITINTAYNIATLNLSETFSGTTTFNSAKLGGQFDLNNKTFKSLGHVYTWPNNTGTVCLTNQTGSCGPGSSTTYDTMQNVGTGEGSIYKGNSTNTNFQFKTLKQGSHISLTNNTNDVTISTTGLLSSALLSLNGDTTAAQVVASGNTNHITVTNAGANHNIDTAFKINNSTCAGGKASTSFDNKTGQTVCSTFVTAAITSLNGQSGPSVNIVGQTGNVTITNSTNQVQVGLGTKPVIIDGAGQNITKRIGIVASKLFLQSTTGNPTIPSNALIYAAINDSTKFLIMDAYGTNPSILMRQAGGTMSSPTKITTGNVLGTYGFGGYQQTTNAFTGNKALMEALATQDWTSSANGNKLVFQTTPNGSSTLTNALILDADQSATFANKIKMTPITDPLNLFTNAIWKSSTNTDVLKYRNNANTTTYSFVSTISATNATRGQLSGNGTGTTSASLVMDGVYATITPANTGRITVSVSGDAANSVSGDGCNIGIRQGTSNMGANGAAVAGSALGDTERFIAAAAAQQAPFSRTYDFSGTVGTKYFFDLGFSRITGGTCTLSSVNWDLVEH